MALLAGVLLGISIALAIAAPNQTPPPPIVQRTPTPPVVCHGPLIPYGKLPTGTRYSTVQDHVQQPFLVWHDIQYLKVPGKDGRLWGFLLFVRKDVPDTSAKEVLLYAPKSQYCSV